MRFVKRDADGFAGDLLNFTPLWVAPKTKRFLEKGYKILEARQARGASRNDIFTHLLASDPETGAVFTKAQLQSNAQLVIVAGTDTSASTLTALFTELAQHPEIQAGLHKELTDTFTSAEGINVQQLTHLPYLNAVINETLRLWPAVPGGARARDEGFR